jgi:NTE family protein
MSKMNVSLALQGGGSHGAYTWGVLDRILEERDVEIEALSGASAGAMNAAVLASGYAAGGRNGAREALERFWTTVSEKTLAAHPASAALSEPATRAYLVLTRYFSPYQLNPLDVNPLREIVSEQIDFERLRAESPIKLFVSATRVRDGSLRLFTQDDLTREALLASACLPGLYRAVEIDGEPYWDGGLAANPPLAPLVYRCEARDIIVVTLCANASDEAPETAEAIRERFSHLSFSSSFWTEFNSIALAKTEAERAFVALGRVDRRLRKVKLHLIEAAEAIADADPATRLKTDARFLGELRDRGRSAAEEWLEAHFNGSRRRSHFVEQIRRYALG